MNKPQAQNLRDLIRALQECNPAAVPDGHALIERYVDTLVAAEREACAKLAMSVSLDLAARIRARGKKGKGTPREP